LTKEKLKMLHDSGCMPNLGQGFCIKSQCDGQEKPTITDMLECVEFVNGKAVACPATNPYTEQQYKPIPQTYYVYECEIREDSGG
jgi:hypothetical protein